MVVNNEEKTVFLVDDNASNLMIGKNLLSETYKVFTCNSGARMFKLIERITPALILLDIEMPEMNGYEIIKQLKGQQATADIPVILVTAHHDNESKAKGLSLGAVDYITKPFSPQLLLERIERHLGVTGQDAAAPAGTDVSK